MNKFYHFGDSFATCNNKERIFSKLIAHKFGLNPIIRGGAGKSNFTIASRVLEELPNMNKGDKVLLGFTFFTRGDFVDLDEKLKSMNVYYDELNKTIHPMERKTHRISLEQKISLMGYYIDYSWDYYMKVFKYLFKPIISIMMDKGIDVRYVYLLKNDLTKDGTRVGFKNQLQNDLEIKFDEGDFIGYLKNQDWLKEESVHYKWGIQDKLAYKFIELWEK